MRALYWRLRMWWTVKRLRRKMSRRITTREQADFWNEQDIRTNDGRRIVFLTEQEKKALWRQMHPWERDDQ